MRIVLPLLAVFLYGSVLAGDLSEANKLLEAKSYPQAIQLLTRAADAGDAGAQLRLGQMYWYGEGVQVDRARADALFAKAAAAGNAEATTALGMTAARARHAADIDFWTTRYDGADLKAGKFACQRPTIPLKSTTNEEIGATNAAMESWRTCYNGFVDNLADAMPPGKRIPAEVADLLTDAEMEQAKAHLDQVYKRVLDDARAGAARTMADHASWEKSTAAFVKAENDRKQAEADLMRKRLQPNLVDPRTSIIRDR
jgi:TPR repeat protein